MAKQILTSLDLLSLPSLTTPKTGSVGFGAKSDGLYQRIGTVETKLSIDGHTHTIAQITGLQGALDSKATQSDIDTAVENLEIGGRNLLRDSKNEKSGVYYPTSIVYQLSEKPIVGERYTISGWFKFSEGKAKVILVYNSNPSVPLSTIRNDNWPYEEWFYVQNTFVWTNKSSSGYPANDTSIHFYNGAYQDELLSYAKFIKLEKGNKATDWTPAPEDQVSDWNESNASSFSFIKNKPTLLSQFTDDIGVASHIANKSNPHSVTKAQVGLGNVDNVKQATKSEFDTHTANSTIHITSTERTNWNDANSKKHTHGNKSVIDALTQGHINVLNKLSLDEKGNVKVDATLWATGEISAFGLGSEGGGGGGGIDRLDSWANYTTEKADYYVPASLLVPFRSDTLSRLTSLENGSATSIETTGSGNAITSLTKSGTVITANKGLTFALATHNHDTIYKPIGYVPSWSEITGKPSTFAPSAHSHSWSSITGKPSTFAPSAHSHSWSSITGKPSTFAPSAHNHTIAQITGLQGALDSKATQSDIDTAVNELEIGGRNLIIGSFNDWRSRTVRQYGYESVFIPIQDDWRGKTVTHSFEVKDIPEGEAVRIRIDFWRPDNTYTVHTFGNIVNLAGKSYATYTVPTDTQYNRLRIRVWPVNYTSNYNVLFRCEKLEFGTKPTDWIPAPEDQVSDWNVTDVNSFAFIKNKPTQLSQFTDNIGVGSHIANTSNPHNVTKAQVGLGNVDNTADSVKNVLSATKLTTARTINGTSFNGSANITTANWGTARNIGIVNSDGTGTAVTTSVNGSANVNLKLPATIKASLTGNASSATKLQTARTIAGVSFDGTSNIAIPFANLASKPTTLAGYGITDAVTLNTTQTITGAKTFSSNVNMLGSLNITGASGYSEGIRIKGVNGISSIWFNAINNSGYDPKMYGLTVDSTGLRFRYGTGSTPSDIASISNTGNITASAGVNTPKVDLGNGFTIEPSGTELVFKYNGVIKQRMLSDGTILATGGVTALATN